ncbi:MAG: tetratricopeptide repeat protein [bacterium]|nr:tetratricopeptide repeat protein [bacterium]
MKRLVTALCIGLVGSVVVARGAEPPTFNRDVAPILYRSCTPCHRPGESGPFNLVTYNDVRKRGRQVVEVTQSRFMPPWLPEPGHGEFLGSRRLSDAEVDAFANWVSGGMPEGAADHLPPLPEFIDGWALGEPDLIVRMPEAYTLEPEGFDVFRNFVFPADVDRPRWVRAVELRPGNPKRVHHAVMRVDPTFSSRRRAEREAGMGFGSMNMGDAEAPGGHVVSWTPGMYPYAGADDIAWKLERGADIVLQLHMLPSGKPEPIRPSIGFHFAGEPPSKQLWTLMLRARDIDIPAGEANYLRTDQYVLPTDVDIVSVYPHAHYLGRDIQGYATLPDGTRRWLVRIKDWNFDWQDQYRYVEPVRLPAGSTVHMHYVYDNSAENPRNPTHPPERVVGGTQSTDEMGSLTFELLPRTEGDLEQIKQAMLEQDLEKDPGDWLTHHNLGVMLQTRGDLEGAIRHYRRTLELNPPRTAAYNNLGVALQGLGRREEALQTYRRALEYNPHYSDAHFNMGNVLLELGRPQEAVQQFEAAIADQPYYAKAHYNLALVLQRQGRVAEAVEHLRLAIESAPDDAEAHNNLGSVLAGQGRMEQAEQSFRRAVELDPQLHEAHENLAGVLLQQGWVAAAIERYRLVLALDPGAEDAKYNLSIALELMGELEQELRGGERALASMSSPDPALLAGLASLHAAAGNNDRALALAQDALKRADAAGSTELAARIRGEMRRFRRAAER